MILMISLPLFQMCVSFIVILLHLEHAVRKRRNLNWPATHVINSNAIPKNWLENWHRCYRHEPHVSMVRITSLHFVVAQQQRCSMAFLK